MAKLFYYVGKNVATKSMTFEVGYCEKSHEISSNLKENVVMLFKMSLNHLETCYILTKLSTKSRLRAFPLHKQSFFRNSFAKNVFLSLCIHTSAYDTLSVV